MNFNPIMIPQPLPPVAQSSCQGTPLEASLATSLSGSLGLSLASLFPLLRQPQRNVWRGGAQACLSCQTGCPYTHPNCLSPQSWPRCPFLSSLSEEPREMTDEWCPGLSVGDPDRLSLHSSQLSVPRAVPLSVLCPIARVSHKFQHATL